MKVRETREFLRRVVSLLLDVPVLLVGGTGVGKSWIVRELAAELRICFVDLRLAQQEPGDLIGIPYREAGRTLWSQPQWWPPEGTFGILFLDELNRAPQDVLNAILQLTAERRLHTHVLPPGWAIVAAINPDTADYRVEHLDRALLRRFVQIRVVPTAAEWTRWARDHAIDPRIVSFIESDQRMLQCGDDVRIEARPTPDGYRMLHVLLAADAIPAGLELEVFSGILGVEAAAAFEGHLARGPVSFVHGTEILARYPELRQALDAQDAAQRCLTLDSLRDAVRADAGSLDSGALRNLAAFLRDLGDEWKLRALLDLEKSPEVLRGLCADPDFQAALDRLRDRVRAAPVRRPPRRR